MAERSLPFKTRAVVRNWSKCEVIECPLSRRFQGISRPDADTLQSTRAGRHSMKLKGRPGRGGNTAWRASLWLTSGWWVGWNQALGICSRELELSLHFPAELWLNRYKPAAHSGCLEVRVLPPPTSPGAKTRFELFVRLRPFLRLGGRSLGCETWRKRSHGGNSRFCLTGRFWHPICLNWSYRFRPAVNYSPRCLRGPLA
jgi:hypothetical protein